MAMEGSTGPASAFCANCQKPQAELNEALKRCSRCQSVRYCSTSCQRAHWPQHKTICTRATASPETEGRHRAITRLRLSEPLSSLENEMIFFLEKTTPHLDDISVAGPFYPRTAIIEQIQGYMHKVSYAGMASICDLAEHPELLHQLEHIRAPLNADLSKFMIVRVVAEHNPVMASRLPGPAFNVIRTVPFMPLEELGRNQQSGPSPYQRVKESEVLGCFATVDEAKAKAIEEAQIEGELLRKEMTNDSLACGSCVYSVGMVGRDSDGEQTCVMIEVRFDDGTIRRV